MESGSIWLVVCLSDDGRMEVGGAFGNFDEAMSLVSGTPRSGCVELELGRDYRPVKNFKVYTADHPEGIDV